MLRNVNTYLELQQKLVNSKTHAYLFNKETVQTQCCLAKKQRFQGKERERIE